MEYSTAKTSVWWDIENCEVPKGWDAHAIAQNMSSALLNMNYYGPVSILAYGDTNLIPHHVQQALSSTGVGLNHVPAGVKDASDKKILVDMLLWAVDNPAPANIMLISGDRDFSNALHQLSMRRYTILLAQPPHASAPLVAAAKNVWLWTSLASGGPPLTSGESSQLVNNRRCNGSQSGKPTGSSSVAGHTNATSSNSFRAYLSDKRHTSQAVFVASHKAHASVSVKPVQETDVVEPVLCTVCQISCISKEAYARHTYGKRHQDNLKLQSGKVENVPRGPAGVPKEVLTRQSRRSRRRRGKALIDAKKLQEKSVGEKWKPREVSPEPQLQAQNSQENNNKSFEKYVAMLNQSEKKSQPVETITEPQLLSQNTRENTKFLEKQSEELREIILGTSKSSVKERLTRTKDPTEKLREASEQAREESYQREQEVKEEVKEVNAISENLACVFNGLNRESRIPKESRGCLDVIPERVLVPPDVNVTGEFKDDSKHKQEGEKECGGRKEHLGEAAKRGESEKVPVDNLWTRLWWGKS